MCTRTTRQDKGGCVRVHGPPPSSHLALTVTAALTIEWLLDRQTQMVSLGGCRPPPPPNGPAVAGAADLNWLGSATSALD